ncbi:MAG: GntR family transcriptional regulator [Lentisphaeria bacterium]
MLEKKLLQYNITDITENSVVREAIMDTKISKITEHLEKMIISGHFAIGERLLPMRKLAAKYQVSTMVIQLACRSLEERGLVVRSPRSGIFISERKDNPRLLFGLLTDIRPCNMARYYEDLFSCVNAARSIVIPVLMGDETNIRHMLSQKPVHVLVDLEGLKNDLSEVYHLADHANLIFFNRFEWEAPLPEQAVLIDRIAQTEITLRYFLSKGHSRIVFLGHHDEPRLFKRQELTTAAARCGLEFESTNFMYCAANDFTNNVERLKRIFSHNHPTAIFSRSDNLLLRFVRCLIARFPNCKEIDKVGCYNTEFSRMPGEEFPSFDVHWKDAWQMVFAKKTKSVDWITPTMVDSLNSYLTFTNPQMSNPCREKMLS